MKKYLASFVLFLVIICITGCGKKEANLSNEMASSETNAATVASETAITVSDETTPLTEIAGSPQTNETQVALSEELVLAYSQEDGPVCYFYDTKGRLVHKEIIATGTTIEYVYGEGDQLITENYYSSRMLQFSIEYDSHGNPDQRYSFLGQDGSGDEVLNIDYTNKYDDLGRISEIVEDYYYQDKIDSRLIWCYNYFADGGYSVDLRVFSFVDGVASESEHTITYYNSEKQTVIEAFFQGETEILFHEIEYDEYGNIQTETYVSYNPGETEPRQFDTYSYKNAYNDDGQLVQKIREHSEINIVDGVMSEEPATVEVFYVYDYDGVGNLILERTTNCESNFVHENIYRYVPLSEALYIDAGLIPETDEYSEVEQVASVPEETESWLESIEDTDLVWKIASLMETLLKTNPDVYEARVLLPDGAATQEAYGGSRFLKLDNVQVNGYWIETVGLSFSADCTANTVTFFVWTDAGSTDIGWVYDWDGNLIRDYDGQTLSDYVLGIFEQDY